MTSTPDTIAVSDFVAVFNEDVPPVAKALADLHVYTDGTGDTVLAAKLATLHDALGTLQNDALGLVPESPDKPQPEDGGGNKHPPQ